MGSGTSKSIVIDAKVRTSLEGMDRLRKELKTTLADNKLELSAGSSLAKLVNEYDEARKQLDAIISKGFVTPEENKKSKQLSERVANIYTDIVKSLSKIENLEMPDLKKMFPSSFSAKTSKGLKEIANYYEKLGDKEVTLMGLDIANKELSNMETTLQNLQSKRTKLQIDVDIEAANKRIEEIEEKKKALQNEVYDSLVPKEVRDSQGKTQRERDQEEVKKAQEVYDAAIQLRNNLKKSKARAQSQQDLADLDIINKNERDELAANQLEKAQAKQIKEKLEREVSRRTGANPSRGRGYEAVEDKDIQAQYLAAVDNLERLRTETAEIKKKYKARREEVEERPKAELTQARKNAETQVEVAKQNLDAAKQAQKTNAEARQIQEDIARQKAEKFASGEEVQGVSADKVEEQRQYNEQLKEQLQIQEQLSEEKKTAFKDQETKDSSIAAQDIKIQKKKQDIKELENALTSLGDMTNVDKVFSSLEELGVNTDGIERTEAGLQQIRESLLAINSTTADNIRKHLREVGMSAEDAAEAVEEMREGLKAMDDKDLGIKQQEREIEDLQQSFLHFFSIGNAIELFKRTVRESIETVKELDAVMTETAVVTDFTVGDMWEKLPTYAKQASQLGASIKDLYSATTLYYQQGLDTDQAMSVGVETMKMARIANMESSDATKAMTAALRGFNMEINETSATRINDVYSELAAITAADTNQIATAMSKTASIASSANMEFETTAALLAQIIETTQEAPETAGTAMKTIIARFTEVKELFDEGLLTGEDEEGESIDINKIDAALKKVGISLKDFLRGEKGIDDIFLELASKWDSLDLATQRYIATTAAGSRQQSRFIAMMSNYDRTMELVNAANNSAGASQEQYEKTLDSMDAKLQKLQNSWDTYVMGLANQDFLKGGIDILTMFLNAINSLTDALSGGKGLSKTLLSFATAFGALKLGKTGINLFSEGLFGKKFLPEGKTLEQLTEGRMQSVFAGFQKGIKNGNFASVFTETVFDREGFKQAAKAASKQYEKMLADPELKSEEVKKAYTTKKELLDKASTGDVEAGRQAGMQIDTFGLDKARASLTGVSTAAMGAGMAIGMVGGALQNAGFEKGGEAASDFGSALMGLGTAASALSPMLATLGLSAGWLTAIIVGISAVYAGAKYMIQTMYEKSPEGRLEAAQEATEYASKAAEDAAEAYDSLNTALEEIGTKTSDLNKLAEGTDAWKQAVRELNEEVLNLVDKYPELNSFISRDTNGVLQIDYTTRNTAGQTAQDIIDSYEQNATAAKVAGKTIKVSEIQAQDLVDYKNFQQQFADKLVDSGGYSIGSISQEDGDEIARRVAQGQNLKEAFDAVGITASDEAFYQNKDATDLFFRYGQSVLGSDQTKKTQLSSAATSAMEMTSLDYATGDYIRTMEEDILTSALESSIEGQRGKYEFITNQHKQQYAASRGWTYTNGKFYDDSNNEVGQDLEDSMIGEYLANLEGSKVYANYLEGVNRALTETGMGDVIGDLISNDGSQISADLLKQVDSAGGIEGLLSDSVIENMAKALGLDVEGESSNFKQFINQNLAYAQTRIDKQRAANAQKTQRFNKRMTEAQAVAFAEQDGRDLQRYTDFLNSLEDMGDDSLASAAFEEYARAGIEASEQLTAFTEEINWNNPIEAAKSLRLEAENGTGATKEYAKALLEVQNSSIGAASQMQYFWNTASGEDFQEDLNEIVKQQGELTGADVLELAESYSVLGDMMENTEATAEGMAKALNLLGKKDLKIEHLTDAVLASLGAFDGLNSVIYETLNSLSEFDAGIDEDDVAGFMSTAADTLTENVKKGAWGNSQNRKYLDYLLGSEWDTGAEYGQAYEDRLTYAAKKLKKNKDNMLNSWKDLAEGKDFYGQKIADSDKLTGEGGQLGVKKLADGGIELTGYEGKTTQQIVEEIQTAYKVSEQYAKMMLTDFSNYSSDLMYELSKNDFVAGMEKTYEKLSQLGDKKIIDETEIKAIMELFGKTREEVVSQLGGGESLIVSTLYNEEGVLKQTGELLTEVNRLWTESGEITPIVNWAASGEGYIVYYEEIMSKLADLHIPEEARQNLANELIASTQTGLDKGFINYQLPSGQKIEVEITPDMNAQDIQAAIYNESEISKGNLYGQGILRAFENSGISLKLNLDEALAQRDELSKPVETTIQANVEPAQTTIDNFVSQNETNPIQANVEGELTNKDEITSETTEAVQSANKTITIEASGLDQVEKAINNAIPSSKTIGVSVSLNQSTIDVTGAASGTITISAHADGIKNSSTNHPALVSEEGPELIQTKDGAYLTGLNGPEIVGINKGDTVYTAEETKQILKGSKHSTIPRFAQGYTDVKSGSGGKSSDDDEDTWENSFDKLYNLVRKIDEELRQRERIERRYEKLLQSLDADANKIISVSRESLAQLEKERMLQEQLVTNRKQQINAYQSENSELMKYANVTQNDRGEDILRIDWEAINSVTDTEEGERIEEYVSQLEEWFDSLGEAEDALWEIEDAVEEIKERGKEEYFELEDLIKESVTEVYQEEIDELSKINDSINQVNADLVQAIQDSINKQRKDRDNQRTEDKLAEKQRRLAYLKQDTSGANDMEILRLEKELSEEQEDYTDTLIDQKISELQEQNDKAAKQREQQIKLAQAQLDHYIESGEIWEEVYRLMDEGLDKDSGLVRGSRLEQILRDSENFTGMSEIAKMEWMKDTNNMIAQALAYLEIGRQLEDIGVAAGTQIEFTTKDGRVLTGTVDAKGNVRASDGKTYNNIFQGYDGKYYAGENIEEVKQPVVEEPKRPVTETNKTDSSTGTNKSGSTAETSKPATPAPQKKQYWKVSYTVDGSTKTLMGYSDKTTAESAARSAIYSYFQGKGYYGGTLEESAGWARNTIKAESYYAYKKGGLADFTGPAWLDGTKSRPELVLNARDTQNFIQLKDILGSIMTRNFTASSTTTENNGDINYDIDINVETIGSDYDVEQVANKVKSMISENGRYRNNNAISLKR